MQISSLTHKKAKTKICLVSNEIVQKTTRNSGVKTGKITDFFV